MPATDDQRAALVSKHNLREGQISATESIIGVMREVSAVGKDGRNQAQNFNFRGIDGVLNAVGPALRKVGGFIVPNLVNVQYEHGSTAKGAGTVEVKLTVKYSWHGTDGGAPIKSVVVAEAMDMSDKATAKAWSVAYRTFLLQVLCLPTQDPDPDAEYIERGVREPAPKREPIKQPTKASVDWLALGAAAPDIPALKAVYLKAAELGELDIQLDDQFTVGQALHRMRNSKGVDHGAE